MKSLIQVLAIAFMLVGTTVWAGSVQVDVELSPAGSFIAKTNKVAGHAVMTPDGGVIAKDILVDLNSLSSDISLRDKHMKERLETKKHPSAKLVKATGKNGKGEALIEIKGKKLKVKGTYSVKGNTLKAQFPVKLADLNINDVRYMGVGVKDTVVVNIDVPIKKDAERSAASKSK